MFGKITGYHSSLLAMSPDEKQAELKLKKEYGDFFTKFNDKSNNKYKISY